jgi:hypothetical protein
VAGALDHRQRAARAGGRDPYRRAFTARAAARVDSLPPMDARALARIQALARVALGGGLVAAPGLAGAWVGGTADKPGGRALAVGLGARDLALGLGTLQALRAGHGAPAWLRAGLLADAADCVVTLKSRDALPALSVPAIAAMAGGSALLSAWLQAALD